MKHRSEHDLHQGRDLDEIAPDRFLILNPHVQSIIKHEGVISGRMFELTGWRRAGLLARLRERGFSVRTLADRVAALPAPPAAVPIGAAGWRSQARLTEQLSYFDPQLLGWHPIAAEERAGASGMAIRDGWVLRRRKGRGAASYYLAQLDRTGGIGLRPLGEASAVLLGLAQARAYDARPLLAGRRGEQLLLPQIELPPAYRSLLELIAQADDGHYVLERGGWPFAEAIFARLGFDLSIEE